MVVKILIVNIMRQNYYGGEMYECVTFPPVSNQSLNIAFHFPNIDLKLRLPFKITS